jgi:hypothetical protein
MKDVLELTKTGYGYTKHNVSEPSIESVFQKKVTDSSGKALYYIHIEAVEFPNNPSANRAFAKARLYKSLGNDPEAVIGIEMEISDAVTVRDVEATIASIHEKLGCSIHPSQY